jgi:hypothetical protein
MNQGVTRLNKKNYTFSEFISKIKKETSFSNRVFLGKKGKELIIGQ